MVCSLLPSTRSPHCTEKPNVWPTSEPCPVIEDDYSTVTDVGTIIDTALIKAYVKTKHANLTTLLTVRNCCHIKVGFLLVFTLCNAHILVLNDVARLMILLMKLAARWQECEKVLTDFTRFADLVQLYKGKNLHRKALELLAKCVHSVWLHQKFSKR